MNALPESLAGEDPTGIHEGIPIAQFEIGAMHNFVYLVIDWNARMASVVDPQSNVKPVVEALDRHGLELASILLTHTHFDHIAGVPEFAHRYKGIPIHVHPGDAPRLADELRARVAAVADGMILKVGALEVEVLHTPGHSIGECSYLVRARPPFLLTGDTVFIRDCGRTDLDTGSDAQMFASIQRIKKLAPETIILPGHHYQPECASTIGTELLQSPPFRCRSVEELASLP